MPSRDRGVLACLIAFAAAASGTLLAPSQAAAGTSSGPYARTTSVTWGFADIKQSALDQQVISSGYHPGMTRTIVGIDSYTPAQFAAAGCGAAWNAPEPGGPHAWTQGELCRRLGDLAFVTATHLGNLPLYVTLTIGQSLTSTTPGDSRYDPSRRIPASEPANPPGPTPPPASAAARICASSATDAAYARCALNLELPRLMSAYPQVKYWAVQNEPDISWPTEGAAGARLAGDLWLDAQAIVQHQERGRVIVAGETTNHVEFCDTLFNATACKVSGPDRACLPVNTYCRNHLKSTGYLNILESTIVKGVHDRRLRLPKIWSFHPYNDVTCDETNANGATFPEVRNFINSLKLRRPFGSVTRAPLRAGTQVWLTESGVWASESVGKNNVDDHSSCAFPVADPANLQGSLNNQIAAAKRFLALPSVSRRIRTVLYWLADPPSPHCWHGGTWDSELAAPDGALRPAYYVLANQAVPGLSGNPNQDASWLLPPAKWSPACNGHSANGSGPELGF